MALQPISITDPVISTEENFGPMHVLKLDCIKEIFSHLSFGKYEVRDYTKLPVGALIDSCVQCFHATQQIYRVAVCCKTFYAATHEKRLYLRSSIIFFKDYPEQIGKASEVIKSLMALNV